MVGVAQLVESRIVIPVVVGSSPIFHPISFSLPAFLNTVPLSSIHCSNLLFSYLKTSQPPGGSAIFLKYHSPVCQSLYKINNMEKWLTILFFYLFSCSVHAQAWFFLNASEDRKICFKDQTQPIFDWLCEGKYNLLILMIAPVGKTASANKQNE